ncbi:MAG: DinB family protein [Bacteroidota bacterium]|nr:DinB family protein [Bacteroidota bacterium]
MIQSSLTHRLKDQHKALTPIIIRLNDRQIQQHHIKGKWSIHEQIAHLAKYQPTFIDRVRKILLMDNPEFESYSADNDDGFEIYCAFTTYELLKKISSDREVIYNLVTKLPPDKLDRIGTHSKYGKLNILDWTEFFLLHEAHHLFAIFQLTHTLK